MDRSVPLDRVGVQPTNCPRYYGMYAFLDDATSETFSKLFKTVLCGWQSAHEPPGKAQAL
jgi:hypothetical protein